MSTEALESFKHLSPDSGYPITLSPLFNPSVSKHVPSDGPVKGLDVPKDRGHFADPEKKALFSVAEPVQLTESIGTLLKGGQLSQFNEKQLDELALLVAERGVVFFQDQDMTVEQQVEKFGHFGILDKHPMMKDKAYAVITGNTDNTRRDLNYSPWPHGDWHSDTSFEIHPPSFSMLRMEEHPPVGGDTAWVSAYGLYDELSDSMKKFLEGLHAVHTSRLQYETILDLWGVGPSRAPVDTHHPAVRTHPVTGLKALNYNGGFCTGFAELNKLESDKLIDFLQLHIHMADDHLVRFKWAPGSIAMWDNRLVSPFPFDI